MRARGGGGAAAWVAGILAAPGAQGGWRLGQQEIQCSSRVDAGRDWGQEKGTTEDEMAGWHH